MDYETLVSTEQLAAALDDPDWVIFDCRFELSTPDWGFADYLKGHIPGAIYVDLNKDLASPPNFSTGRHPLPDAQEFGRKCAAWGVSQQSQVVVYDHGGGSFAGRMWWMLRALGHNRTALLDGGLPKWKAENRPLSMGSEQARSSVLLEVGTQFNPESWLTSQELERLIDNPSFVVIDGRSVDRYRGENEVIDPIAGHIPGAVNRFHGLDLTENGTFKPADVLRTEFQSLLDGVPPQNAIVYCGSGVTSCHLLAAMEIAGLKGARLYAGSWSEWIRDPKRPRWQP